MTLFVSYYQNERQGEIDYCLKQNCDNPYIESIIVFAECKLAYDHPKIYTLDSNRPTYNDFFQVMKEFEGIKILANSDIYFDDSLSLVKLKNRQAYCLTRHEWKDGDIKPFESNNNARAMWSQDAWFFIDPPDVPKEVLATLNGQYKMIPYCTGTAGCENHLAFLLKNKYQLINPYPQIKAIHVHREEERNYSIPWRITGQTTGFGRLHKVQPSRI